MSISFDTMVGSHLLNEELDKNLLTVASLELGVSDWGKGKHKFGDDHHPPTPLWGKDGLAAYCGRDTAYTHLVFEIQREKLVADQDLAKLMKFLILPGLNLYTKIEKNGIWVDTAKVNATSADIEQEQSEIYQKMISYVPEVFRATVDFSNDHFLRRWLFSPEPDGLGLTPITFTEKTNAPQVSEEVLHQLDHDAVRLLLTYRKNIKLLQFFAQWLSLIDSRDRLHPKFNFTGTVTGRRSCDGPNLQQVPRDRRIRSCLGAPKGWRFLEVDYSAVEVRIAAWFAEELAMLNVFSQENGDIYRYTAAIINGIPESEVTKEQRQGAKAIVLGFIYGLSAKGFVMYAKATFDVTFTLKEGQEFREKFFQTYPNLVSWHENCKRKARKDLQVKSPLGRVRRLLKILSTDDAQRAKAERQSINSPVQGMGGDLTLCALVELSEIMDPEECIPVGDVHDAILFQVREDVVDKWAKIILKTMEEPSLLKKFDVNPPVRLKAEGKIGQYWGDGKEFSLRDGEIAYKD